MAAQEATKSGRAPLPEKFHSDFDDGEEANSDDDGSVGDWLQATDMRNNPAVGRLPVKADFKANLVARTVNAPTTGADAAHNSRPRVCMVCLTGAVATTLLLLLLLLLPPPLLLPHSWFTTGPRAAITGTGSPNILFSSQLGKKRPRDRTGQLPSPHRSCL